MCTRRVYDGRLVCNINTTRKPKPHGMRVHVCGVLMMPPSDTQTHEGRCSAGCVCVCVMCRMCALSLSLLIIAQFHLPNPKNNRPRRISAHNGSPDTRTASTRISRFISSTTADPARSHAKQHARDRHSSRAGYLRNFCLVSVTRSIASAPVRAFPVCDAPRLKYVKNNLYSVCVCVFCGFVYM